MSPRRGWQEPGAGDLEAGYRRLLHLYPRDHRDDRGEEMLAVLLDAARPGQRGVAPAEAADLVRGAAGAHARALTRRAARRPGTTAAALTLVVALGMAVAPVAPPAPAAALALPDAFAGYSPLTDAVGQNPPGPAVAVYGQGSGAELFDTPQTVVAGASGAYRRLDLAERRGGMVAETSGDQARFEARQAMPAPTVLSPDGARVAVGGHLRDGTGTMVGSIARGTGANEGAVGSPVGAGLDVAVQDLSSGEVVRHVLGDGRDAWPTAWSPDGRLLAVLVHQAPANLRYDFEPYAPDVDRSGWLAVVDTSSGTVRRIKPKPSWSPGSAVFSPDGRRLAVQDEAGALRVVDLVDGSTTDLGSPSLGLVGGNAWSPDGALLLGVRASPSGAAAGECIAFVSLTARPAPGCLPTSRYGPSSPLGWTGARSIALAVDRSLHDTPVDAVDVVGVDVDDGSAHRLTSIPAGSGDVVPFAIDVAGGVLLAGDVTVAPPIERGRWPWALRMLAVVLAAGSAGLVASAAAGAVAAVRRRALST